jgi:hypothetical protein
VNRYGNRDKFDDDPDEVDAINEDPSDEDIERLDHESAYCPDCGAEVWDSVEVCPKCYAYLGGHTSHRPKIQNWMNSKSLTVIIVLLIVAMLIGGLFWFRF